MEAAGGIEPPYGALQAPGPAGNEQVSAYGIGPRAGGVHMGCTPLRFVDRFATLRVRRSASTTEREGATE